MSLQFAEQREQPGRNENEEMSSLNRCVDGKQINLVNWYGWRSFIVPPQNSHLRNFATLC